MEGPRISEVGPAIERMRLRSGFKTIEEAAPHVGLLPQQISSHETGYKVPKLESLLAYANAYRCTLDALIGRDPGTGVLRTDPIYYVSPTAVAAVRSAKRIRDLRSLYQRGIVIGHSIAPTDQTVTADEFVAVHDELTAKIADLGGFPPDW